MVNNKMSQEFSNRLNQLLDAAKIAPHGKGRQLELAKLVNVSQVAARKWLVGEAIPTRPRAAEIAEKLNCSPTWLLYGENPTNDEMNPAQIEIFNKKIHRLEKELEITQQDIRELRTLVINSLSK